jgi:hypothetical protein
MDLDGDLAHAEVACDLLVQPSGRDECRDLILARR